jgi:hypothetical protein
MGLGDKLTLAVSVYCVALLVALVWWSKYRR